MCSKLSPPRIKPTATSVIKKETAVKTKPPARKIRSKTRKPKYLSLRLELSPGDTQHSPQMITTNATASTSDHHHHHHQLNLFPLHPEHLVADDKLDSNHEDNMASFFSAADDGATTTLTGLLSAADTTTSSDEDNTNVSPSSLNYGYSEEVELVRTAMRNRERDASEEKWVCYSEVVEKKEDEVSSSNAAAAAVAERLCEKQRGISLKLDYDEIMNAWSDKGPLYIHMESPQTVPVLHDDDFLSSSSAPLSGLWRVPEMSKTNMDVDMEFDGRAPEQDCMGRGGGLQSQREASVQRYKEKRQNRLFAKKIRYQVRKLNAEKRPRIKGRFVKRS